MEQEKVIFLTSPFNPITTGIPSPIVWAAFNSEDYCIGFCCNVGITTEVILNSCYFANHHLNPQQCMKSVHVTLLKSRPFRSCGSLIFHICYFIGYSQIPFLIQTRHYFGFKRATQPPGRNSYWYCYVSKLCMVIADFQSLAHAFL